MRYEGFSYQSGQVARFCGMDTASGSFAPNKTIMKVELILLSSKGK